MEDEAKESSPAPSTAGLKGVFAKARRGGRDNSSTTSINGTDSSESRGLRSSLESNIEKLKSRTIRDASRDKTEPSSSNGISKLLHGRIKKKRKKREAAGLQQQEDEEAQRGRSIGDRGGVNPTDTLCDGLAGTKSRSTLDEDGASSLLTDDSGTESPLNSPPPLVNHDSHIGYLTTSSPLINTSNKTEASSTYSINSSIPEPIQSYSKSTTFPVSKSASSIETNLVPRHAATMDTAGVEASSSTPDLGETRNGRGISPGSKFRGVFAPGSKEKAASPPTSPDRASLKTTGSGGKLGGLFSIGDRRNSINFRRTSKASEERPVVPQPLQAATDRPASSSRDLPLIVTTPPQTPPNAPLHAPITVTPPTPTDQIPELPVSPSNKAESKSLVGTNPNTVTSASGNMISHRRIRSDPATHQPSKLSNAMSAPLTPMIEEARTPGSRTPGSQGSPAGPGGFFSSVFSAAQSAANTLSNTIANNNQTRSRNSVQIADENSSKDQETSAVIVSQDEEAPKIEQKRLAIDTLGTGDLSLSHLGISNETLVNDGFPEKVKPGSWVQRDEAAARAEDVSAARAISVAYSEKPSDDNAATQYAQDLAPGTKPKSMYESSITGDRTPPNGSIFEGENGIKRSGSVRSRVEAVTRRHRNSSAATGSTTIGTAIAAGHAALANPTGSSSVPKLTGFAVANKKRNRDFHQLFRSVPEDDYLIEDYSCALQRDIILAGRIYISEGHICFSSNILGWVTTLIISFDEVVSAEKENTAMVFPNAIAIQTLQARHTFRSLLSREATYDLLIGIWKINHPSLKSSLNGVQLVEGGTGDKTEKVDPVPNEDGSVGSDDEDEIYDEDEEEEEGLGSFTEAGDCSPMGSDTGEPTTNSAARKASAMGVAAGAAAGGVPTQSETKAIEKATAAGAASTDFPGPATHAPTECSDRDTHYDKVINDEVIPAPLGKVYSMIFGPASGGFMTRWLLDEQKVQDLQMEDNKKGLSEESRTRTFSYIKPLYASIGPKQTKCLISETMDAFDLEKAVSITSTTQTPDVPSGNVFSVKTKYCLTWAPGNGTRLVMNCGIEWTAKSWLKGPIEKGANDGQVTYAADLSKALKAGVSSRSRSGTVGSKLKSKGRRRKGDGTVAKISTATEISNDSRAKQKTDSWGLLEPLHGVLGPIGDIFGPLISANMVIGALIVLLLITWLRGSKTSSGPVGFPGLMTPERIAAYEEVWQREESELWNWLEERVGMERIAYPAVSDHDSTDAVAKARTQRQLALKGKSVKARLAEEAMSEREVDDAIRITEERLAVLKGVVEQKTSAKTTVITEEKPGSAVDTEEHSDVTTGA